MKRRIAALLALLLMLSGCDGEKEPSTQTLPTELPTTTLSESIEPMPEDDGAFGLSYLPSQGLNPFTCTATVNRALFSLLYESLFVVNAQFRAEPVLCDSFWVSDGGAAYTFSLVPGVRFSDGTPLMLSDVVASIEAARTSPIYQARLSHITSCFVSGDALTVTLDTPYENFALMLDVPIVKEATVESQAPIGTGAYYRQGQRLVRNTYWWQTQLPALRADSLTLTACQDSTDLRDEFEFGETDLVYTDPNAASSVGYRCDYEAWEVPTTVLHYLGFNQTKGYFANETLRTAVTYAIDRDTICGSNYGGFALASPLPCSPNSDLYDAALAQSCAYAPERFTAALNASGVLTSGDYTGYEGIFLVCSEDLARVSAAEAIVSTLQQAGLHLKLEALPREAYQSALSNGAYDLYYGEVRLTANFDLTEFFRDYGALEYGGLSDAALLTLCTASLENSGSYMELCAQLVKQAPICPILFKTYAVYVTRGKITSIAPGVDLVFHNAGNARTLADADRTYTDPVPSETTGSEPTEPTESNESTEPEVST